MHLYADRDNDDDDNNNDIGVCLPSPSVVSDSLASPPASSVLGISQARILERVALSSRRVASCPRD